MYMRSASQPGQVGEGKGGVGACYDLLGEEEALATILCVFFGEFYVFFWLIIEGDVVVVVGDGDEGLGRRWEAGGTGRRSAVISPRLC